MEQAIEQHLDLVGGRPRERGGPAGRDEDPIAQQPDRDVVVPDVDGQEHGRDDTRRPDEPSFEPTRASQRDNRPSRRCRRAVPSPRASPQPPAGVRLVSTLPVAKFFVNQGVVASPTDMLHLLKPLLKQTVTYRYLRGREVVAHGTGWVERIVTDAPDTSTYFTPLAITLNIDSFEHLEFETRPTSCWSTRWSRAMNASSSSSRRSAPAARTRRRSPRASSSSTRPTTSRWSCSASTRPSRSSRPACLRPRVPPARTGSRAPPGRRSVAAAPRAIRGSPRSRRRGTAASRGRTSPSVRPGTGSRTRGSS